MSHTAASLVFADGDREEEAAAEVALVEGGAGAACTRECSGPQCLLRADGDNPVLTTKADVSLNARKEAGCNRGGMRMDACPGGHPVR